MRARRPLSPSLSLAIAAFAAGALSSPADAQSTLRPPGAVPTVAQLFGAPPSRPAPVEEDAGDLVVRLNQLENHVRQLNGQIEQLQFRNQQLEQELRRMNEDLNVARGVGGRPGAAAASTAPNPAPTLAPAPPAPDRGGRRSDAFDPTANPNAPGAPRTLGGGGGLAAPAPMGAPVMATPGGREPGQPLDITTLGGRGGADSTLAPPPAPPVIPPAVPGPAAGTPRAGPAGGAAALQRQCAGGL